MFGLMLLLLTPHFPCGTTSSLRCFVLVEGIQCRLPTVKHEWASTGTDWRQSFYPDWRVDRVPSSSSDLYLHSRKTRGEPWAWDKILIAPHFRYRQTVKYGLHFFTIESKLSIRAITKPLLCYNYTILTITYYTIYYNLYYNYYYTILSQCFTKSALKISGKID